MKLLSVVFQHPERKTDYIRMVSVLRRSVAVNSPSTPLQVLQPEIDTKLRTIHAQATEGSRHSFLANTQKLRLWQEAVEALEDGDVLALMDADTVVLRDLSAATDIPFDVAYTIRPESSKLPFNAGVVLVRGNDRARTFFRRWRDINDAMLVDPNYHEKFRRKFGGINQASLGALIEDPGDLDLVRLPCEEWNSVDQTWHLYDPDTTRIAHVKGDLRRLCLGLTDKRVTAAVALAVRPLWERWKHFDQPLETA